MAPFFGSGTHDTERADGPDDNRRHALLVLSTPMKAPLHWGRDGHDWPHRSASRFVQAGGLRWHLQQWDAPSAPMLLLLHGTGASTHSWRDLVPALLPHFRVVAVDLPGHGFTQRLRADRCTLPGMAAALHTLMLAEHWAPRVVVGHSAGAALMLRLALDGHLPDSTLIGLNAALLPFGGWGNFFYASMARMMAGSGVVPHLAAWRARDAGAVRRVVASTGSQLSDDGVAWYARLMRSPDHVANVLLMMANWDLEPLQRELPQLPALHLLVGERDSAVPPWQAERIAARAAGVTLHRLPGLGHLAHEEAPRQVAETILAIARESGAARLKR